MLIDRDVHNNLFLLQYRLYHIEFNEKIHEILNEFLSYICIYDVEIIYKEKKTKRKLHC